MRKMKYESPKMEVVYFENGAIDTSETSTGGGIIPDSDEIPDVDIYG